MSDLNSITIIGNVVRDAEMRYSNGGLAISRFTLAFHQWKKDKDVAGFVDCTAFGKQAERVNQYLTKGKKVGVSGNLDFQEWERDGKKNSRIGILVQDIQLLSNSERHPEQPEPQERPDHVEDKVPEFTDDIPF